MLFLDSGLFLDTGLVLDGSLGLAATSAGVSGDTAGLSSGIVLGGVSDGDSSTSGDLNGAIPLAGTSDGVSTTTGALGAGGLAAVLVGRDTGVSNSFGSLYSHAAGASLTIEVTVSAGGTPNVLLDVLDGARLARWYDPLDDVGSGSFVISTSDPKATPANLAKGNIIRFRLGGVARYAIVIEAPELVTASVDGKAADYWEIKGRGLEAILSKARQAPGASTTTPNAADYGNVPAASVLVTAIAAASVAGRAVLPSALTLDFTAALDSRGAAWSDSAAYVINAGTDYTDILRMLPAINIDVTVTPNLVLHAYRDGLGSDLTGTVVFRQGKHIRDQLRVAQAGAQQITRIWVEGKSGAVLQVFGSETDPAVGVREGYLKVSTTDEPSVLRTVGANTIAASTAAANALQVPLMHGLDEGSYEPYVHFDKGDTVKINVPGWIANQTARVASIAVAATDEGTYTVDVDLNSIVYEDIVRLKRELDRVAVK